VRVLFLTHRLPYAPNRGDRLRAYHILQWLRDRASVDLVSLVHDDEEASHVDETRAFVPQVTTLRVPSFRNHLRAIATLATNSPLTHTLLDAPGIEATLTEILQVRRPDVVFAFGSGMGRFALAPPLAGLPLILDLVDVDSRKWQDLAGTTRAPLSLIYSREARTLGAFEARAAAVAAATLVVNEREAEIARQLSPTANVQVIANGVELDRLRPAAGPSQHERVVFCGVMNYAPNDHGIRWFINEVWPTVKSRRPASTLAVVGADPDRSLRALCARDHTIELTGKVPDVRPWLWESAVAIAPLHVARGVQNKALEAIACGLPIVVTPAVAAGLSNGLEPAFVVADAAPQFAQAVIDLLELPAATRRARAVAADLGELKWSNTLQRLELLLLNAASGSPGRRASEL
jgi:sugar transferase (PEP-CTERM/EpsH1 system associated)